LIPKPRSIPRSRNEEIYTDIGPEDTEESNPPVLMPLADS
jgi:hypothetical protein